MALVLITKIIGVILMDLSQSILILKVTGLDKKSYNCECSLSNQMPSKHCHGSTVFSLLYGRLVGHQPLLVWVRV